MGDEREMDTGGKGVLASFKNVALANFFRMINVLMDCLQDHEIAYITCISSQSYEKNNTSISFSVTVKLTSGCSQRSWHLSSLIFYYMRVKKIYGFTINFGS